MTAAQIKSDTKAKKVETIAFKICEASIAKIKNPEPGKKIVCWDTDATGFGLVATSGCKVYWVRRRFNRKQTWRKVGHFSEISAEAARAKAKSMLADMANGIDPYEKKKSAQKKGTTLLGCFEEYISEREIRQTTIIRYRDVLNRRLHDWYDVRLTDITRNMVRERYKKIIDTIREQEVKSTTKRGRDGHAEASLVFRLLSSLFNYAMASYEDEHGKALITENPTKCLSAKRRDWRTVPRRQRVILPGEMRKFYEGIQLLRSDTPKDFLMFLMLTGFRLGEARGLIWDEVDLNNRFIMLPQERTKNKQPHGLPLSDYLTEMLKRRKEFASNQYVFSSRTEGCPNFGDPKRAIKKVGDHMEKKFSAHDCRRSFITVAEMLQIPPYSLKALLNHSKKGDVTAGYIITQIENLREPMQLITQYVLEQMGAPLPDPDTDTPSLDVARRKATVRKVAHRDG